MCTLTLIPLSDSLGRPCGYRAVMNRDESRTRAVAEPPARRSLKDAEACWPTDPDAGGTWCAATSNGLTLALLNIYFAEHEPSSAQARTRGEIIPALAACATAQAAAGELIAADLSRYRPFRLVATGPDRLVDLRWDRHRLIETIRPLSPACFVSSGLGDHYVEPRLMLFDSIFGGARATPEMQDSFHRHVWPQHEHLSVMMTRPEARTTSVTTVEARWNADDQPEMLMRHEDDNGAAEPITLSGVQSGLVAAAC